MFLRCQQLSFGRRRCGYATFGDEEVCRWHKIAREFRADLKPTRGVVPQGFLISVYGCLAAMVGCFAMLARDPSPLWILAALYFAGWAAVLMADAVMALDFPFSGLPYWAQQLAGGLVVSVVSGALLSFFLARSPEQAEQFLKMTMAVKSAWWLKHGPRLLVAVTGLLALVNLKLLLKRIFFVRIPRFGLWSTLSTLATGSLVVWALQPYTQRFLPAPDAQKQLWQAAIGGRSLVVLGVIWFITFNVAEVVNLRMRRASLDAGDFKATVWPSFPICMLAPWLGMLVARHAVLWLGTPGAVPFGLAAALATIPFCILGTLLVLRWKSSFALLSEE